MERTENQVTSDRSLNGSFRSIGITNLTHHHDIWVETQNTTEAIRERTTLGSIDWNLRDTRDTIFDRILESNNLAIGTI